MDYDYWSQDVTGYENLQWKSSLYGLPKKMNGPDVEKIWVYFALVCQARWCCNLSATPSFYFRLWNIYYVLLMVVQF